jgi:hypothetical protein
VQLAKHDSFLSLVRLGIGHRADALSQHIDWETIQPLALQHGLSAIVIDGIERLPENKRPPKEKLLEWIGEVLQGYEYRFEMYRRSIAEMANFYNSHGYKMMVLKGYACSLNWPKPEHRPCGDIDIWLFGKQKEADDVFVKERGVRVDKSHHHHTVFNWGDFTVENHYDFVNIHAHRSSAELEKVFKELGMDDSHFVEIRGERVYLPSSNLHALFLIKHMVSHFAAAEISLRQVLDWAFFVERHSNEVDWEWLTNMLDKYHMKDFFNIINAICIEDLGFAADIFSSVQFLPSLKERVLQDILEPEFVTEEPKGFMSRLIYKYKRWQGNAWKQRLCYEESRWEMFWTGIWAKILKPASI